MGIVKNDGGLTFYDGGIRIVDSAGEVVANGLDPADYQEYIGEKNESVDVLEVALLHAQRLSGWHLSCGSAGPPERRRPLRHAARRPGTGGVPRTAAHGRAQLLPLSSCAADRDPVLRRAHGTAAHRSGDSFQARARGRRSELRRRRRLLRGAARHADPPLQDRRAGTDPLGEPDHCDRAQQHGDEPWNPAGREALRARGAADSGNAQPRGSAHPRLRSVPQLLDARLRRDAAGR